MANEPFLGRLCVATVRALPLRMRHDLIFGGARYCLPAQKLLNRLNGGAHPVRFRFERGSLKGLDFECQSNEKYYYMREDFESELQEVFRDLVRPGMVVYDIGAHIGIMSLLVAALGGSVYAFEPSPVSFPRLMTNLRLNPTLSIAAHQVGASDVESVSFLSNSGTMSVVGDSGLEIQLIRLDDFVYRDGNPPPALLKIDVEGHGYKVLKGMPRLLSARPTLVVEIHNQEEQCIMDGISPTYRIEHLEPPTRYPYKILASAV